MSYHLKWIWTITKGFRSRLIVFFILELFMIALSLLFVLKAKEVVDWAIAREEVRMQRALLHAILAVFIGFLTGLFSSKLNERTRMLMLVGLQNDLIRTQMFSTWKYVKTWQTGDIQMRIHKDCEEVIQLVATGLPSAVLTAVRLFASFGFLWYMDPMLALLIVAISPLFLFSKLYFRKFRRLTKNLKEAEGNFGHVVQENLRFRMSIRALGLLPRRWRKLQQQQHTILDLKMQILEFSTLSQGIMKFALNAGFLLTFAWGALRLYSGEISFGTMTAFLQLVGRVQTPIITLMGFIPQFIRFRAATDRVQEVRNTTIEEEVEQIQIQKPIALSISNLHFKYEDQTVFQGLDVTFTAANPTAIIGASGRGKTTLIRLLLALIHPDQGHMQLKTDKGTYALTNSHRINFAYVPQGDKLFSGTVRENLQLGDSSPDGNKIKEALHIACAEFVYDLANGLDTQIGESGYGLSEGQAQRIAIARALMQDCSIWLFDEVTSALDPDTATLLMDRLLIAGRDKIMVFVTHDLKLAERCSQVFYMP